jgi:LuxR family maltose regulon positive regulatory protein
MHQLVALQARRVLALRGPLAVRRTHHLAAEWFELQDRPEEAINQALDAGDTRWALKLLEGVVGQLMDRGQADQVRGWYGRAPEPLVAEHHTHLLSAGWAALFGGDLVGARSRLEQLEAVTAGLPPAASDSPGTEPESPADWLRGEVLLLRAYVAWWGGAPTVARAHANRALAVTAGRWTRTSHQASALLSLRWDVWFGDPRAAQHELVRITARPTTREPIRRVAAGLQAVLSVRQGRVRRGAALATEAVEVARRYGDPTPFANAEARLALSLSALDLGDAATAADEARTLAALAARLGHVSYRALAQAVEATALAHLDAPTAAWALFADARADLRAAGADAVLRHHLDAAEARARLEVGDRRGAAATLRRLPPGPARELLRLRQTTVAPDEVGRRLRALAPLDVRESVEARLLLASALAATRPGEAAEQLRAAAATADEAGLRTALRGAPEPVLVLAARLAAAPGGDATARLLGGAAGHAPHHEAAAASAPAPTPPTTVSSGDQALLRVIAEHAGHRAQAAALGITVNTVKTRLRRLYRKLGVSTREDAVRVARSAGLLPEPAAGSRRADG